MSVDQILMNKNQETKPETESSAKNESSLQKEEPVTEKMGINVFYRYTVLIQKDLPPDVDPKRKEVSFCLALASIGDRSTWRTGSLREYLK